MDDKGLSTGMHVVLDRVTKRFEDTTAVSEFCLSVDQGEFIAIIGPSGSGKTTLLRCLAGLERLTSGAIYVRGQRIDNTAPHKRDMAMVWQEYVLFPHMNVEENIEFGLKMRGVAKETRKDKVIKTLRMVDLDIELDRRVDQLSGGERQRVGLARALVTSPQVLLLDEPLASLDRNLRVTMQGELKALQREVGITFIYVTHNQSEALAMADRIVVMNKGMVEQVGTPQELFESPQTMFVSQFVGENNVFEGTVISSDRKGEILVECATQKFKLRVSGESPPKEKRIAFIVRADIISLNAPNDTKLKSYDNTLPAVIIGQEYVGTIIKFTLKSQNGQILEAIQPVGSYRGGNEVILGWNAVNTYILPWQA